MTRANIVDGWRIDITIREMVTQSLSRTEIARVVAAALRAASAPPGASLSVILTDDEELTDLNETHLGHEGPTDVLSFPLLPPDAFPSHPGRPPAPALAGEETPALRDGEALAVAGGTAPVAGHGFGTTPVAGLAGHGFGTTPVAGHGFGTTPAPELTFVLPPGARLHLGDIAVSVERAAAQAADGRGGQTGDVTWSTEQELRLLITHGTLHICGWDHAEQVEESAMRALEQALLGFVPGR